MAGKFFVLQGKASNFLIDHDRVSGTIGAIVTCPLEVVKTRLQVGKKRIIFSVLILNVSALCSD